MRGRGTGEGGRVLRFLLPFFIAAPLHAQTPTWPTPTAGDFVIRDFHFADGETLAELRLHYTTLGTPQRDAGGVVRNAVLVMHGTGGTGRGFLREQFAGVLFTAGGALDATKYFIILPDGIGHGGSSKPSEGLHARFPHYGYRDLVLANYRLLTEHLGVNHLRLVTGTSMGGMQTWLWGETYPDFMDALLPLASLPVQIAGRNRMMRRMILDAIHNDPDWQGGEYRAQPVRGLTAALNLLMMMTSVPLQWQKQVPTQAAADSFYAAWMRDRLATTDANDMLYAFDASRDYDPAPALERIRAPLTAINSADDQVNPPELGILEAQIGRVAGGRAVVLPITDRTRGHGTHSLPGLWQGYLKELLERSQH